MADNVTAIFGGPTCQPEPSETCIQQLEYWLEMARSGEVVGVAIGGICADGLSRYGIGGRVGGYSMLGALEMARTELVEVIRGD
ncbi:hypothetical protein [Paracoccus siganidrum]|uniref:Uncharacterized protein n=1 Tax=Paracoccus siganidrum TaxID=1276757 RepID=A0A419A3N6_9RHOB|nr:hypothetical protein [Paracoccus siganidrum]RJL08419.1 hypothetical protein D3P05_16245 [Paracoccus siganidrum]RMC39329.1 hypothetical protein C9E82_04955 [Paracoccus siganidrum]